MNLTTIEFYDDKCYCCEFDGWQQGDGSRSADISKVMLDDGHVWEISLYSAGTCSYIYRVDNLLEAVSECIKWVDVG